MLRSTTLLALCAALALPGCASRATSAGSTGSSTTRTKRDPNLITSNELALGQYPNIYDAVRALRPQWLVGRGADTIIGEQGEVQARLDDSPLGAATALRQVTAVGVSNIRFVDGITAAGRWGGAYTHGAILVTGLKR